MPVIDHDPDLAQEEAYLAFLGIPSRARMKKPVNGWTIMDRLLRRTKGESQRRYLSGGILEIAVYNSLASVADHVKRISARISR